MMKTKITKKNATKKVATPTPAEKLSQIAAAERVLVDAGEAMTCKAMVEAMTAKGLWSSPGGKTPEATLYSSILRNLRGEEPRFKKVARGQFALAAK
jgi:hypothetical protein